MNFFEELKDVYNICLNRQQEEAVRHGDGPCLLLAVPGAGKTTTLLCRLSYLIQECHIEPKKILSMTFSKASAQDMKHRYTKLFGREVEQGLRFSTIHSFAYQVVVNYNKRVGDRWLLIEGNDDVRWNKGKLLNEIYRKTNREQMNEGDYEQLCNDISYLKNTMKPRREVEAFQSSIDNFMEIYEQYERTKKQNRLMDFDDMLVHCYKILLNHPDTLEMYQDKFTHIQLDEAQDTSLLQHEIVALLAKEHNNIFYVADDDQSIYGFRGAKPAYLFNMDQTYEHLRLIKMEKNYRSTGNIVELCNAFIKNNQHRFDKDLHTDNKKGIKVNLLKVEKRNKQYESIIEQIKKVEKMEEVGVIFRSHFSAVSLVHFLEKEKLPYRLKGHTKGYFNHWIVNDLLSIIAFSYYPMSTDRFKGFYYKLKGYYISKAMLDNAYMGYDEDTVFDKLLDNNDLPAYQCNNILRLRDDFAFIKGRAPEEAIEYIMTQMGYLEFLIERSGRSTGVFEGYNRMVEALKLLAKDAKDVDELKANIKTLERAMLEASKNRDTIEGITLTTAHSSKGLEWDAVFLIDLIDGLFPAKDVDQTNNQVALEEERRLFYVAMTRARNQLILYETTNQVNSIFLEEVKTLMTNKK